MREHESHPAEREIAEDQEAAAAEFKRLKEDIPISAEKMAELRNELNLPALKPGAADLFEGLNPEQQYQIVSRVVKDLVMRMPSSIEGAYDDRDWGGY